MCAHNTWAGPGNWKTTGVCKLLSILLRVWPEHGVPRGRPLHLPTPRGCSSCKSRRAGPRLSVEAPPATPRRSILPLSGGREDGRPSKSTRTEFLELLSPFQGRESISQQGPVGVRTPVLRHKPAAWATPSGGVTPSSHQQCLSTRRQVHAVPGPPGLSLPVPYAPGRDCVHLGSFSCGAVCLARGADLPGRESW